MGKNVLSYLGTVFPDRSHNISNILIMNIIINITTVRYSCIISGYDITGIVAVYFKFYY